MRRANNSKVLHFPCGARDQRRQLRTNDKNKGAVTCRDGRPSARGKTQTVTWRPPGDQVQVDPLKRHDAGETLRKILGRRGKMRIRGERMIKGLIGWVLAFLEPTRVWQPLLENLETVVEIPRNRVNGTPVLLLSAGRLSRGPTFLNRRSDL